VAEIPPHLLREEAPGRTLRAEGGQAPGGENGGNGGGEKRELEAAEMLAGPAKRQAVQVGGGNGGGRPERGVCHFFLRGRCKKGRNCKFLHQRTPRGERVSQTKVLFSEGL
jgi:hypothetical protein